MKCPVDGTDLTMSERQGIEIDYCPKCRGVWLDRGELDKIIERSEPPAAAPAPAFARQPEPYRDNRRPPDYDDDRRGYDRDDDRRPGYGRKRRKSFLGEIFDFD